MFRTIVDDVLSQGRSQTRNVGEQVLAGRIEVDPHGIYTSLHRQVQSMLQFALVHIVLVLTHAYALGVYLDQFCQGVGQSSAYANGTAYGHVVLGKLLSGYL